MNGLDEQKTRKIVQEGDTARTTIKEVVNWAADIVAVTFGPHGKTTLIDRGREDREPLIIDDGKTTLEELAVDDECKYTVLKNLNEISQKTSKEAGDGTSSAVIMGRQLMNDAFELIEDQGKNSKDLEREIEEAKNKALAILESKATIIDNIEQLKNVAFVSIENKKVADIVAEAVWAVGPDGYAKVDNGYDGKVEANTQPGIKFYGKYAADFMQNVENTKLSQWKDVPIIVTNHHFKNLDCLQHLFEDMKRQTDRRFSSIIIMGSKFDTDIIRQVYNTQRVVKQKTMGAGFYMVLCKIPSLTEEQLENVASYVGARFINTDDKVREQVKKARFNDLGHAKEFTIGVDDDEVVIIGGRGETDLVDLDNGKQKEGIEVKTRLATRIEYLKGLQESEEDDMFKLKRKEWIEKLSGGVSVIKVDAITSVERSKLKPKVENGIRACKAALQKGIIQGAGLTLKDVAKELGDDNILFNTLEAPYRQIQKNAGKGLGTDEYEIPDYIYDPLKVVSLALEYACSVAKTLITTGTIIAIPRDNIADELGKILRP